MMTHIKSKARRHLAFTALKVTVKAAIGLVCVAPHLSAQEAPATEERAARPEVIQRSVDRLDLDTTVVTGNRELPRVLYIVPWKKAELGELPAQPFNTLLDEVLSPVDRDVFKREVKYFQTINNGAALSGPAAQSSSEKKSP
jgi:hypothetical protein